MNIITTLRFLFFFNYFFIIRSQYTDWYSFKLSNCLPSKKKRSTNNNFQNVLVKYTNQFVCINFLNSFFRLLTNRMCIRAFLCSAHVHWYYKKIYDCAGVYRCDTFYVITGADKQMKIIDGDNNYRNILKCFGLLF